MYGLLGSGVEGLGINGKVGFVRRSLCLGYYLGFIKKFVRYFYDFFWLFGLDFSGGLGLVLGWSLFVISF